jgi:hypothetical protein
MKQAVGFLFFIRFKKMETKFLEIPYTESHNFFHDS